MTDAERIAFLAAGARLMVASGLRIHRAYDGSVWLTIADAADRQWWGAWSRLVP